MFTSITRLRASLVAAIAATAFLAAPETARADDWLEKAFRSSTPVSTSSSRKAARTKATARTVATTTRSASKSSRSKPITIRAARTDDAAPTLRRQASASITSGGESGIASYYWQPQPVASGGRFNPEAMTAAHKTLPFGTRVRVTRADNGRSVVVTINDRGPFIAGRIIDLSRRAARDIGMTDVGITRVSVAVLGR